MYTAFYGLREKPFALSPNPRFLYLAASHREALAHLLYGVEQREGFIAITGEVGTGKTTLCRTLIERLGSDTEVAYLFNPSRNAKALMEAIASELALPSAGLTLNQLHDQLNRFLLEKSQAGRRVLLIVDEAQNLSIQTLEQVRLLSNLETASSKLIQILLLGQPELDRKLDSSALRQLRQRIGVRWRLAPLSLEDTRKYVAYRLRVAAGAEREIFSRKALSELHRRTGGVPRLINVLSDRALLAGYAKQARLITPAIVRQAAREVEGTGRPRRAWVGLAAAGLAAALLAGGLWLAPVLRGSIEERVRIDSIPSPAPEEIPAATLIGAPPDPTPAVSAQAREAPADDEVVESLHTPTPVEAGQLAGLISQQDEAWMRLRSLNAILEAFGETGLSAPPDDELHALQLLEWSGLAALPLDGADFGVLRTLNHPALLTLYDDSDSPRVVALMGLEDGLAELRGASDRGAVRVPIGELRAHWDGQAWVIWRPFEPIPNVVSPGESGDAVVWLQDGLRSLGYLTGPISGEFDPTTRKSLMSFQRGRHLEPDGAAGPRTQMVIYDLLGYAVPRLTRRWDSG